MKVVEITVHAGRKFNHPFEQYSNLSPAVTLRAVLEEDDDPALAVRQLQDQAEILVQSHKESLLRAIEEGERRQHEIALRLEQDKKEARLKEEKLREIDRIEATLQKLSSRLDELRSDRPVPRMPPGDPEDMPF